MTVGRGFVKAAAAAACAVAVVAMLHSLPASAAAGGNILVNGDFELPAISQSFTLLPNGTSALPGWTTSGGGVEIIRSYWQPAHGSQSVNLSSSAAGAEVSQTVSTSPGARYLVSWYLSGNPQCATPPVRPVVVLWNGSQVAEPTFDVSGHSFSSMGWTLETASVTAASSKSTLSFQRSTTITTCGIAIDDVSLTLTAPAPTPQSAGKPGSSTTPPHGNGAASNGSTASGGSVSPSTIATSLPTPSDAFSSLPRVLLSAVIAVAAILLITFPAHLFNNTFSENYEDIVAFWDRHVPLLKRLRSQARAHAGTHEHLWVAGAVILVGALLGGLLDPTFGFNASSFATYLAVMLATLWGIALTTAALLIYRRSRGRDLAWSLRALPAGLAIAAGCVVVSRLAGFQPGYLYGIVCGAAFVTVLARTEQGHAAAITTLVTVIFALLAWLLWTAVNGAAVAPGAAWPLVVLDDFLGAVFVGGLIGSTIGMVPLRFLPGGMVAGWHRGVWTAVAALVTFAFVAILLLPGRGGHPGHAAIATVIALFLVFGAGSVVFALYFARKKRLPDSAAAKPAES
ncbi:MAG: DUF642 domain-containing protein [Chloroflexi bacterium]|nr:DUF642 domain-containing protein [Chloroflexota bacterium]